MNTSHKVFIDAKPIIREKEVFDLKKLKAAHQDLSDYFKMPIEEISRRYWHKRQTSDKEKQGLIEKASREEEVIGYYRTTDQYLYELMSWEAQKDKQREFKKLYLFCRRFNIKRILDFGGGTGGLSIYLNSRGLKCDYLDIPGQTFDFARWRFNRHKIKLKIFSAFEDCSIPLYNAAISYDVFEHIFDLAGILKKINGCLKERGYLISKSSFSGGGLHLLKNEIYQNLKKFNELSLNNGFEFIGQLKADRFSRMLNKIAFRYLIFSTRLSRRLKHGGNFIVHRKIANS